MDQQGRKGTPTKPARLAKSTLVISRVTDISAALPSPPVDPFSKRDWYDMKVPAKFNIRNTGKTLVMRTQGTKIASDGIKSSVFEVNFADLQNDEVAFRKSKPITKDVQQEKNTLTNFHGMDLTHDKMCSLVISDRL